MAFLPTPEGAIRAYDGETYYQLNRRLGSGAFGEVFLAMNAHGRMVALKTFSLEKMGIDGKVTAAKLHAEAEIMMKLKHNNVVAYVTWAMANDTFYMIMEYLSSGTIRTMIGDLGCIPFAAAKQYLWDVLSGLRYLHDSGIAHCDVKPDNILFSEKGECKLADFGSVVFSEMRRASVGGGSHTSIGDGRHDSTNRRDSQPDRGGADEKDSSTNKENSRKFDSYCGSGGKGPVGTARYISPEGALGHSGKPQDVYSVGLLFIEMLTGRNPWDHCNIRTDDAFWMRISRRHLDMAPEVPFGDGLSSQLLWPKNFRGDRDYKAANAARDPTADPNKPLETDGYPCYEGLGSTDPTANTANDWDEATFVAQFAIRTLDLDPLRRASVAQLQELFFQKPEYNYHGEGAVGGGGVPNRGGNTGFTSQQQRPLAAEESMPHFSLPPTTENETPAEEKSSAATPKEAVRPQLSFAQSGVATADANDTRQHNATLNSAVNGDGVVTSLLSQLPVGPQFPQMHLQNTATIPEGDLSISELAMSYRKRL